MKMYKNQTVKELTGGWGGEWTKRKIEILVEYAQAYLQIMKDKTYWRLLYFDGFAGAGIIISEKERDINVTIGAARRILELEAPRPFDHYVFVEKSGRNAKKLTEQTKDKYRDKDIRIVVGDCNEQLKRLAKYLQSPGGKNTRVLAYLDPHGMQLEWASVVELAEASIDLWILVPTGLGVNRLLKKNGEITESWLKRLSIFLGMSEDEIKEYFYREEIDYTLFGEELRVSKEEDAINKSALLYKKRLEKVFQFVSEPYVLKSSRKVMMYHMYLASNNRTAAKIANDIVKKYNKME